MPSIRASARSPNPRPAPAFLQAQQGKEGEPTLVVELKSARTTIGADQQLQAWNNVRELIRGGAIRERDPVDVYVVGGAVDELDGNPRVEGRYRNVRITSFDYGHLIARAKRLTFGLYDDLKDGAPFLRQHREDIAAAQQPPKNRPPSVGADPAHRERGADERRSRPPSRRCRTHPRRGEYEGEHVVIGQRKNLQRVTDLRYRLARIRPQPLAGT